ncbi:MAG TPA: SCO family protein [Novosphingobium sp.]|nr:SCO family protein [Novosphingobium sp.]
MTKPSPFPLARPARRALAALSLAGLALLGACHAKPAADAAGDAPLAGAAIGGDFTLVDKAGHTVRWADFAGHYRIVYFGYTFCPDACPTDLNVAMRGLDRFAKAHPQAADRIRPIFITIDPARDTPAAVGQFAAAFSPRLLGLTGTPDQVAAAAKAFAVYYARGKDTPGGYLMDHSRIAYLFGPKGEAIDMLPVDKGPDAVAQDLARWVK